MTWRPQGFRLGKMRERITIQRAIDTVDAMGQPLESWQNRFCEQMASWEPISGQEGLRGKQVEAGTTNLFTIRYREGIQPTDRVKFRGRMMGIVRVEQVEGGRRYLLLHCKEVL